MASNSTRRTTHISKTLSALLLLTSLTGLASAQAEQPLPWEGLSTPPGGESPKLEERDGTGAMLSAAMSDFIFALEPKQLDTALYRFEDPERFDFRLAPLGLEGLRVDDMTKDQWTLLRQALAAVLSQEGLEKTDTIRSLEKEVAELENGLFGFFFDRIRNPSRYFIAVFGRPSDPSKIVHTSEPWGLRFDGHHLSLNWTSIEGQPLAATPIFFGGQPREVPAALERAGLRVLDEEEDQGIELIRALLPEQRIRARLPFSRGSQIRRPMFRGDSKQLEREAPVGIDFKTLNDPQRAAVDRLINVYLRNFVEPLAERYRGELRADEPTLRFAFALPDVSQTEKSSIPTSGDPLYYRIQSDRFLIEFDNTSAEADHIHVVFRSIDGDFGRDLLKEHYKEEHRGG